MFVNVDDARLMAETSDIGGLLGETADPTWTADKLNEKEYEEKSGDLFGADFRHNRYTAGAIRR